MKIITYLSLFLFAITFTSCDETKKVIDAAGNVQLTGNYTVSELKGQSVAGSEVPSFSLSAVDNSIKGTTSCNSVFGNYSLDLYAINFGDMAVTKKMCDSQSMKNESSFLNALNNTGSYDITNDVLTFYSKTDRTVLLKAKKKSNK